jgi:hypothetical protein
MASIYHGFIEQYHSVEGLMKAKFQRDFPYHNVEDFNAWFQHDSEFESREMGAERLSYPQKQYLKEKKTWGRFCKKTSPTPRSGNG